MIKVPPFLILLLAWPACAGGALAPAATVKYVSDYFARQQCNLTNTAANADGANMRYLLKSIDICNGGTTNYGLGASATDDWANLSAVHWCANNLLKSSQYAQSGLIANLTNVPNNDDSAVWKDQSGNGNHFTLFGAPSVLDSGVLFAANPNQYARSANKFTLAGLAAITIELRFTVMNPAAGGNLYEFGENWNTIAGSCGAWLNWHSSTYLKNSTHTNGPGGNPINYDTNYNDGLSHTMTHTYSSVANANGHLFYFDGVLKNANSAFPDKKNLSFAFVNHYLYLTKRNGTPDPTATPVLLSSVRVYNRQLAAAEICQNAWKDYRHFGGAQPGCAP